MANPQTSVAESMTAAFAGMLADTGPNNDVLSYVNEDTTAIPFGSMVGQGTLPNQILNLAAISDEMVGIAVHSHAYDQASELALRTPVSDLVYGVARYGTVGVLRKGRIWVYVEEAVTPASSVLVRCVLSGGSPETETPGVFRDTADASDDFDCSAFARYLSTTTAAGLVLLEIDMTNFDA